MSLFLIRYDYDTIITNNRDYRYDFDYSTKLAKSPSRN